MSQLLFLYLAFNDFQASLQQADKRTLEVANGVEQTAASRGVVGVRRRAIGG
jgi:hypothetical protein